MDKRYELFCLKDRLFYDALDTSKAIFPSSAQPGPEGWERTERGEWVVYLAPDVPLPAQGWKIHVSACQENAEKVLDIVRRYCFAEGVSFKQLSGPDMLFVRNAKYAPRGASGKLLTVYPVDDTALERVLGDLAPLLEGEQGPYILSDLRKGDGPLYVRYGGFADRRCPDEHGRPVPAIEDPEGRLVPDRRDPVFYVPPWVAVPDFFAPHLAARNAVTTVDLPYRIEKPLHFSNGGGVYQAVDTRTGDPVVLKEARPYAGLASDRSDAVTRLQTERRILERLDGIDGIPGVRDYFELGGHHFLVEDFVEGTALNNLYAVRHPLLNADPSPAKVAEYSAWALGIHDAVARVVGAVHERGVVINDLHMFNIIVRPDGSVALIDFEVARTVDEQTRQSLANPGFVAPADRRGTEVDAYGLACLRLALFMPLTMLFVLDRGKARQLAEVITQRFPVHAEELRPAVEEITRGAPDTGPMPSFTPDRTGWEQARENLSKAILASATPERDDRLFPGDIEQFGSGGLGLAHGAAGVLYTLDAVGCGRHAEHESWLIEHATRPSPGDNALGLYDGLFGAAYVLARFEHTAAALQITEICLAERWERLGPDLFSGLTGIALALEDMAALTGKAALHETAERAAELVAERLGESDRPPARPGLLHGAAGSAVLFVRRFETTGAERWLDRAAGALRRDLAGCVINEAGAMQVVQTRRTLPYLGVGSVGIGVALDEYLRHRDDEEFRKARSAILQAARTHYTAQSGLFNGRAGLLLYLARTSGRDCADRDEVIARQVRDMAWYALPYGGGVAFPGDQLLRLSMDLGTGTAGVLLALGAALRETPVHLPFIGPVEASARNLADVVATPGRG